ncbi:uncharacterized protein PHACADRAFT_27941 [Phanerochaete carnosa HHB-10118-sp]|uniref:Uncharacterized protein n=1 Tax=Phanerochaete carnosa (strain HHB-10118-sp) TaxID=650164 RepID=K5V3V0_PHACS|nr:uncharacterized protein PHACADRAFT_27941 [Phanerochaete carnosa HHB-10118-sp]EKM57261.1 hypothetical protein PHACADRAFT_27941 [Phanerochaete carnosa HHB-10118-sp]
MSSEMCKAIACAGNGICQIATTSESIIGKCSKLVRASQTYILKNVSADWGSVFTPTDARSSIHQAPAKISAIYPGHQFIVFAFIEGTSFKPPKKFIMDLNDADRKQPSQDAKAFITRLGIKYLLVSRYTSFVAIDKCTTCNLRQAQIATAYDAFTHTIVGHTAPSKNAEHRAVGSEKAARKQLSMTTCKAAMAACKSTSVTMTTPASSATSGPLAKHVCTDAGTAAPAPSQNFSTKATIAQSSDDKVLVLVQLQLFDGSFPASEQLGTVVGSDALAGEKTLQVTDKAWATALAIARNT